MLTRRSLFNTFLAIPAALVAKPAKPLLGRFDKFSNVKPYRVLYKHDTGDYMYMVVADAEGAWNETYEMRECGGFRVPRLVSRGKKWLYNDVHDSRSLRSV